MIQFLTWILLSGMVFTGSITGTNLTWQVVTWEAKTTTTEKQFVDVCRQIAYNDKTNKYRLTVDQCLEIEKAGLEYWVHPKYILSIWLSENILWWSNHWDGWCSKWWYQMNSCARKKYNKKWQVTNWQFVKEFEKCSLDFSCSTRWTAERIKNYYCKSNKIENLQITNPVCAARHQGYYPKEWYKQKLLKNLYWIESLYK